MPLKATIQLLVELVWMAGHNYMINLWHLVYRAKVALVMCFVGMGNCPSVSFGLWIHVLRAVALDWISSDSDYIDKGKNFLIYCKLYKFYTGYFIQNSIFRKKRKVVRSLEGCCHIWLFHLSLASLLLDSPQSLPWEECSAWPHWLDLFSCSLGKALSKRGEKKGFNF